MNGRRALRAELESRMHVFLPDPGNAAAHAPMAKRKQHRATAKRLGIPFRPVPGYFGIPAPDHKDVIAAMKCIATRLNG